MTKIFKQGRCAVSFLFIITIFVCAMYLEEVQTDGLFVCAQSGHATFCEICKATGDELEICTDEMLRTGSNLSIAQSAERMVKHRRTEKLSFHVLCANIFSAYAGSIRTHAEKVEGKYALQKEFVINYIHHADGKKRMS